MCPEETNQCNARWRYEPSDNYFGLEVRCDLQNGHTGTHVHQFRGLDVNEPYYFFEIRWLPGNIELTDYDRVNTFPVGSWHTE